MRAQSTADVSLEDLRKLVAELGPDFRIEVDENQIFFRSVSAPSWVAFFAEADWWVTLLKLYAGLYVAEIVKEAGKETWKNRGKIVSAAVVGANRVKDLGIALGKLRSRLSSKTRIAVGLPVPNDYDGTRLELLGAEADELAVELAIFVHYLPALTDLIREERLNGQTVAAGIRLVLLPDASLEVSWQDGDSLERETRVLKLEGTSGKRSI